MKFRPVLLLMVVLAFPGSGIAAERVLAGAIVLSPQTTTIAVGQTIELTATAVFGPLPSAWQVDSYPPQGILSMPRVAVPANGPKSVSFEVTGLAPGVAVLSYTTFMIGGGVRGGTIGQVTVTSELPPPPPPPPCVAPAIVAEPPDILMKQGEQRSLDVGAVGTEPLAYRWYAGIEGGSVGQMPGAVHSRLDIPAVAPATYVAWVVVTNACGERTSRLVTVVVQPCDPPIIVREPLKEAVPFGGSVSLSVQTIGSSAPQYAWFVGAKGDTSSSAGSGNPLIIEHVTRDSSYWVRVTDGCGFIDSDAAMITIRPDRRRAAR
jgi:hypothetical protein